MTTNPENPQQPSGAVPPPPAAGYGQPGAVPPPPAAGYGAPQGGYPPAGYGAPGAGAPLSDSDQRTWAIVAHVGAILFSFVAPLVVWLVFKGRGALVEDQAKEALNWSITVIIVYVVGIVLSAVLIGIPILFVAGIAALVFGILAAVAASSGQYYRYPVTLRLIK
ncbi:DUF4870 domain-containing protein [Cellulomonas sp. 179-A 4D5 NHS]|uniref:DUF4870 domain-containing protein n=1 Tax=Cellulomonas sp. 179-A 4D5 NHS TaxID=3142378 RepID=UPI0039A166A6